MRKLLLVMGLFVIGVMLLSFHRTDHGSSVKKSYINTSLLQLKTAIEQLKDDCEKFENNQIDLIQLQQSLRKTRNTYKTIEFYIAFHYPEFAKTKMNGAPLFRIEPAGTASYTLPPEGLQVLDELIFADEAEDHRAKITEISSFLYNSYNSFYPKSRS